MSCFFSLISFAKTEFIDDEKLTKKDSSHVEATVYNICKDGIEYSYIQFPIGGQILPIDNKIEKKCDMNINLKK